MPVAFLGALVLFGTRTCSSEIASVDIVLAFGEAKPDVRSVQVEVFRGADRETLAEFKQHFGHDGVTKPVTWKLQLDPGMYTLEFRVMRDGRLYQFSKSMDAVNGATITLPLGAELSPKRRLSE